MKERTYRNYTECTLCGFLKLCRFDGRNFFCMACDRDDLTLEQKKGKHQRN